MQTLMFKVRYIREQYSSPSCDLLIQMEMMILVTVRGKKGMQWSISFVALENKKMHLCMQGEVVKHKPISKIVSKII